MSLVLLNFILKEVKGEIGFTQPAHTVRVSVTECVDVDYPAVRTDPPIHAKLTGFAQPDAD